MKPLRGATDVEYARSGHVAIAYQCELRVYALRGD